MYNNLLEKMSVLAINSIVHLTFYYLCLNYNLNVSVTPRGAYNS